MTNKTIFSFENHKFTNKLKTFIELKLVPIVKAYFKDESEIIVSIMYSDKVMDHFTNPRNVGIMESPDAVGEVGNPACGDVMKIFLKIDGEKKISDITFQTFGCASAIACSSMVTELAKGKTIDEAERITRKDIADALDGLPPAKMHCSNLGADALRLAIQKYKLSHSLPVNMGLECQQHGDCDACNHDDHEGECSSCREEDQ